MGIERNLESVLERIALAARRSGRKGDDIALMAVSKLHPYDEVLSAYGVGQRLFGENRVQEVLAKFPAAMPDDMDLHLIGHLQTNKVRKIVGRVRGIDSVDSLHLAEAIERAAEEQGTSMPILLELNTSGEAAKSGFPTSDDLYRALDAIASMPHLVVRGLMTVGPLTDDEDSIRASFRKLRTVRDGCRLRFPSLSFDVLSMGMSGDFPIAIEEGATLVRVGTAIFGKRDYRTP